MRISDWSSDVCSSDLADDGQHRHVVEPGVVQPSDQVRRARSGCRETDAEFAGELGMGGGHEGGHLLVPDLDELYVAAPAMQGAEKPADGVAGIAEDPLHAPGGQPFPAEVAAGTGDRQSTSPNYRYYCAHR